MRTTVDLDQDTEMAIKTYRRAQGVGLSAAVNELIRQGLLVRESPGTFVQETHDLGLTIDVTDIAAAVEQLDGPDAP
jgi:hypothetical protein